MEALLEALSQFLSGTGSLLTGWKALLMLPVRVLPARLVMM